MYILMVNYFLFDLSVRPDAYQFTLFLFIYRISHIQNCYGIWFYNLTSQQYIMRPNLDGLSPIFEILLILEF